MQLSQHVADEIGGHIFCAALAAATAGVVTYYYPEYDFRQSPEGIVNAIRHIAGNKPTVNPHRILTDEDRVNLAKYATQLLQGGAATDRAMYFAAQRLCGLTVSTTAGLARPTPSDAMQDAITSDPRWGIIIPRVAKFLTGFGDDVYTTEDSPDDMFSEMYSLGECCYGEDSYDGEFGDQISTADALRLDGRYEPDYLDNWYEAAERYLPVV
jgi:hypothetical protein